VLFPWTTVLENVLLRTDLLALPKAASRERAMRLLEMTGLKDFANLHPADAVGWHETTRCVQPQRPTGWF
jgi:ABC-type nitrate/sulfonate/bicarbonate transport system ATPase subunit